LQHPPPFFNACIQCPLDPPVVATGVWERQAARCTVLKKADVRISMDGRGRWRDNIIVERLWRSLKYESVYLNAYETGSECRGGIFPH